MPRGSGEALDPPRRTGAKPKRGCRSEGLLRCANALPAGAGASVPYRHHHSRNLFLRNRTGATVRARATGAKGAFLRRQGFFVF
jgi:hypothetical protein